MPSPAQNPFDRRPRTRFLEVAQDLGAITPSVSRKIEDLIATGHLDAALADEFLVEHGIISRETRRWVLERLQAPADAATSHPTTTSKVKGTGRKECLVAVTTLVTVAMLTQALDLDADWAITVISFAAWVLSLLTSRPSRTFTQTIVQGLKWGFVVTSVAVLVAAVYYLFSFTGVIETEPDPTRRSVLEGYQFRFALLLGMLATLLGAVAWLALLKTRGLRYAEARLGKLADTIQGIERIIRRPGQELVHAREAAETAILRGLYHAVGIAPGRAVYDHLRRLSPTLGRHMVVLLEPDASLGSLTISRVVHAPDAPDDVLNAIELFRKHHHPAMPDFNEFERLCRLARGDSDEIRPHIYLRFPRDVRSKVMSAAGWTLVHGQMTYEEDATQSLTFDHSYLEMLRNEGVKERTLRWLEVNSFIVAPVMDTEGEVQSVLMVTSTSKRGFRSQDFDLVTAMSRLLTSTRHRT
jgi:hypothetical protein